MSDTNLREINKDLLDKYSPPRDEYLDINPNPDGSFTTSPPRVRDQRTGEVFEVDPATGQRVQTELPPGRTPSLVERLLGTMPSTGFFSPENDYTGVSGTITRKGAHIAVANELEKIKFVAGTFGGMQNRVAIIRYWCKGDKCTQKATVASEAVNSPSQASVPDKSAQEVVKLSFQPGSFDTSALPRDFGEIASSQTRQVFPIPDTSRGREVQPGSGQVVTPSTQPTPAPTQTMGPVLSATPGARSTTVTSPTEAAWQFLFNPEELQLESGPEFNRAETWGVSDLPGSGAANSGQPLAWRFNKNRKLIFGKVLLTGYVLGRRVDSLEKGLQQLFMARSGPGMDGPPVLEFVWGSRVFGPCVIQNLRVRERAWDDGYLVNAEVSFDLEQVPEWTINDGAVDIARPGRQSLVNDPFLPRAETEQTGSGTTGGGGETQKKDEEIKTSPSTNPSNAQNDANLCSYALEQSSQFQTVFARADKFISRKYNPFDWQRLLARQEVRDEISQIRTSFTKVKGYFYSGSRVLGAYVDSRVAIGCRQPNYLNTIEEIIADNRRRNQSFDDKVVAWIHGCAKETKAAIDTWIKTEDPCKPSRLQSQTAASRAEAAERCRPLIQGQRCSQNFATNSSCSSVNGYAVKCINNIWTRV